MDFQSRTKVDMEAPGYQKCPVCDGTGYDPRARGINSTADNCTTCQETKIISKLTGKPPK